LLSRSHHPITAPGYSARRSALAKALGLGRRRQMAKAAPEPKSAPAAKQRRRRRVVAAEAAPTR